MRRVWINGMPSLPFNCLLLVLPCLAATWASVICYTSQAESPACQKHHDLSLNLDNTPLLITGGSGSGFIGSVSFKTENLLQKLQLLTCLDHRHRPSLCRSPT